MMIRLFKFLGRLKWFIFRHSPAPWVLMRFWPPRAYVAIVCDNKILLVQNWFGSGKWSLPGGGVHRGEDSKVGACREIFEETKLILLPSELKYLTDGFAKFTIGGKKSVVYIAKLKAIPRVQIGRELNGYVWAELKGISSYTLTTDAREALAKI